MDKEEKQKKVTPPQNLKFNYIKSNLFRVIHADGVWGGATPQGRIHVSLFNERTPIPQQTVHEITPEGKLGPEIVGERITKDGIVREVEVEAIMDLDVAKSLAKWLNEKIQIMESRKKPTTEKSEG